MPSIPPALAKAFNQTIAATARAVNEHGAPNSFGLSELRDLYGGCERPALVGRALRRWPEMTIITRHGHVHSARYDLATRRVFVS